jgi:hypothetical protein
MLIGGEKAPAKRLKTTSSAGIFYCGRRLWIEKLSEFYIQGFADLPQGKNRDIGLTRFYSRHARLFKIALYRQLILGHIPF